MMGLFISSESPNEDTISSTLATISNLNNIAQGMIDLLPDFLSFAKIPFEDYIIGTT